MPGPAVTNVIGVQGSLGVRFVAALGPNFRVKGTLGRASTVADTNLHPATPSNGPGMWIFPATRCLASGVPLISQSSVGVGPTGPMLVAQGDPRITNLT